MRFTIQRPPSSAAKAAPVPLARCAALLAAAGLAAALAVTALAPAPALAIEPDVVPDAADPDADVPDSWRYQDGEPVFVEGDEPAVMMLSADARSVPAWTKGPDGFVNTRGEVIPDATRKGVDVSEWQGIINWEKVKADGIDFAVLRVGYRRSLPMVDKQWLRNVAE